MKQEFVELIYQDECPLCEGYLSSHTFPDGKVYRCSCCNGAGIITWTKKVPCKTTVAELVSARMNSAVRCVGLSVGGVN